MKYSYETLKTIIARSLSDSGRLIVSMDGCCASGKTTLAERLCSDLNGDLIHADDFFLPPALRTQQRMNEPGGNIHYERFLDQIITPLLSARTSGTGGCVVPTVQPCWPVLQWEHFSCSALAYSPDLRHTTGKPLLVIEGAYCMRPEFRPAYDLSFFLTTSQKNQLDRIRTRNGSEGLKPFMEKWIPLENRYFSFYDIPHHCRFQIET